jgi:hypothetical protein
MNFKKSQCFIEFSLIYLNNFKFVETRKSSFLFKIFILRPILLPFGCVFRAKLNRIPQPTTPLVDSRMKK